MNTSSNWTPLLIFAGVVIVFILLKRSGQISAKAARTHLKNGALVIDVRSPDEFNAGHLTQAVNIPLDEIETVVPQRVKDRNQALLLHCASGMRSGLARRKLKAMGYTNAFNLGSLARARNVVESTN
jgi:phage shock protein E